MRLGLHNLKSSVSDLSVEDLIATLTTPKEEKFYPIELFTPTVLKSANGEFLLYLGYTSECHDFL